MNKNKGLTEIFEQLMTGEEVRLGVEYYRRDVYTGNRGVICTQIDGKWVQTHYYENRTVYDTQGVSPMDLLNPDAKLTLPEKLLKKRLAAGVSARALSEWLDVPDASYRGWEYGRVKPSRCVEKYLLGMNFNIPVPYYKGYAVKTDRAYKYIVRKYGTEAEREIRRLMAAFKQGMYVTTGGVNVLKVGDVVIEQFNPEAL